MRTITATTVVFTLAGAAAGGTGPDLAVSSITATNSYGSIDGVRGYSVAGTLCNIGDEPVAYSIVDADHPVVAQNLYRLDGDRFEQIGMSWLFNTTIPLDANGCGTCVPTGAFDALGVGCSDPHGAGLAGSQNGLSRRSEVNPAVGSIAFPQDGIQATGDAIFKRLQVRESDLQTPGARYFVELQCVAPDDAGAGNGANNASWREVVVGPSMNLAVTGATASGEPAIFAWAAATGAMVSTVEMSFGGTAHVGSLAADNGDGTWTYHYTVHNLDSGVAIGGFTVPFINGGPGQMAFSDVGYHSGEPYDGADWAGTGDALGVSWSTEALADNPDANAIRWGTSYTFRVVASNPPVQGYASLSGFEHEAVRAAAQVWLPASPCPADFAAPFGTLNFFDVSAFIGAYIEQNPAADLSFPLGVFNFHDIAGYLSLYGAGCP